MKRDPASEQVAREKVVGLERKLSRLSRLLSKAESERDKCREASSRYLLDLTEALDHIEKLVHPVFNAEVQFHATAFLQRLRAWPKATDNSGTTGCICQTGSTKVCPTHGFLTSYDTNSSD